MQVEKLLTDIQKRLPLWDMKSENYSYRLWEEVAKEMERRSLKDELFTCVPRSLNKSSGLTMPSTDISLDSSNTTTSATLSLRRRSNDECLKFSRNQFNKSRKRVEYLKRSQKIKRIKSTDKYKLPESEWITSGSLGSRDAVLVFRTNILHTKNPEEDSQTIISSSSTLCSSSSSLNVGAKDDLDSSLINSKAKVLLSLPKNSKSTSSLPSLCKEVKKPFNRRLEPITSPKKRLHDSLSSSENSISSECDDIGELEDDIIKSRNSSCNISSVDSRIFKKEEKSSTSNKHVSFDDKENIDDNQEILPAENMPASVLKITYKFMNTETRLLRKIFARHGLTEAEGEQNFSILWTGAHMKPDTLRNLTPYQRVNHFPRSYELTRKDRLYKNIEKMQHLRGFKHFDIVPQSFVLPLEFRDLVSAHNKYRGPWIVKPAASSRGRGIFIVNSPDQIPTEEQLLVSKYIADPLCIDGHKCDLRVYVLVTSFNPLIIYVYEEGIVRLATVKYDRNAENLWNPCMHLCNYSINKYHSDYIKSRDADDEDVGHKWTLSALLRHLKSQGCDTRQLMSNIEDLIIKSMFACAQSINSACRMFVPTGNNCFELYGFDILIDDTLKPWLLEINLSPSLGIDSPLDTKVKASLMTDLLTLVGIPAFSPVMRSHYDSKWTRFRTITCSRRTNSADPLGNTHKKGSSTATVLSAEEARIVKMVKLQNARRGGFVRIFPTEDCMQRYGSFLDPLTGIPLSTSAATGQTYTTITLHNFNQMLFHQLYVNPANRSNQDNNFEARMSQYERALEKAVLNLGPRKHTPKSEEEGRKLRKQVRKLIESGHEMTQLQSRQAFSAFLDCVLRRLQEEPKSCHEKLILKFVNRMCGSFRAPTFIKNALNFQVLNKDRTAMVAKLLGDYLETYNRDTEAYIDGFDQYGMIPIALFSEFLLHATESDLESILKLHTNLTQSLPFLYNRCGQSVPQTPPIPSGPHGFLKALPSMAPGGPTRDQCKIESFYKLMDSKENNRDKGEKKIDKPIEQPNGPIKIVSIPKKKLQCTKR